MARRRPSRCSRQAELGGLVQLAAQVDPAPGRDHGRLEGAVHARRVASAAASPQNLVPTGDIVIDDNDGTYPFGQGAPGFPSGVTNFQEFLSALVNQTGAGQGFDGNGTYLRANTGGGSVLASTPYPPGGFRNTTVFGNNQATYLGTRPTFTAAVPPYRTDVPAPPTRCPTSTAPAAPGSPATSAPATSDGGAVRRAIREHLSDFIAIGGVLVAGLLVTGYILSQQQQPYPSWVPFLGDDRFELKAEPRPPRPSPRARARP